MRKDSLRHWAWLAVPIMASACGNSLQQKQTTQEKPNVLFIVADDLGYGDLGCFGSTKIQTPYIDSLATDGIKLTQFYAASAVSTPTRASILTGKYPLRFDIRKHFSRNTPRTLPAQSTTIAEILQEKGYFTAHIGKWHLGGISPDDIELRLQNAENAPPGPLQHGFAHYLCSEEESEVRKELLHSRQLYRKGGQHLYRNDSAIAPNPEHWTKIKADEAIRLIGESKAKKQPFFINLWFDVPHTPYEQAPGEFFEKYKGKIADTDSMHISSWGNQPGDGDLYCSMVDFMDYNIGRIVAELKTQGLYENTFIIFTSDNGPSYRGSTGSLRGGKADLHEGGIRVPAIVSYPAKLKPGTLDVLSGTVDMLPTVCDLLNISPENLKLDGISLYPALKQYKEKIEREAMLWQLKLYKWYPQPGYKPLPYATLAARHNEWKLLADSLKGDSLAPVALYNLKTDRAEANNLLGQYPEIENSLMMRIKQFVEAPRVRK